MTSSFMAQLRMDTTKTWMQSWRECRKPTWHSTKRSASFVRLRSISWVRLWMCLEYVQTQRRLPQSKTFPSLPVLETLGDSLGWLISWTNSHQTWLTRLSRWTICWWKRTNGCGETCSRKPSAKSRQTTSGEAMSTSSRITHSPFTIA